MSKELLETIIKFRDARNWKQFHTPANLAKSISIESAELLENFQWNDSEFDLHEVTEEIADIYIYLLLLSNSLKIDLENATKEKISKNEIKYPINLSKNSSKKYTKFSK
jgi:NTP pyrophosphatase (non-canonical NTP hydrolase)